MKHIFSTTLLALGCLAARAQSEANVAPSPQRGLYAIWYNNDKTLLDMPVIRGGQIIVQWADVEPAQGRYDFGAIDEGLKEFARSGKLTTVQVNGNEKPKWLYGVVPHHPDAISHQIRDAEGTLMYWHPAFMQAYLAFVKAYADHLKASPYLSALAGVRMNFNALGTEHFPIPDDKKSLDQWITPKGVAAGVEWTPQLAEAYQNVVMDEFIRDFSGIRILLRNNITDEMLAKYRKDFEQGRLMLFHTSSEMEPRGIKLEHNYHLFYEFARSGQTLAYAEPWASAWGEHGNQVDARWTGPAQWTYWRLLFDLHCGVAMPAVYANDLKVAQLGQRRKGTDARQYQAEFLKSLRFTARYAGYHASPEVAPGAWLAFRHNEKNRMTNNAIAEFTGNYSFLMQQVGGATLQWEDLVNVGDTTQRFGAWAEVLPAGQWVGVAMSPLFTRSLEGKPSVLRLVYLDKGTRCFTVRFAGQTQTVPLGGSNRWKTVEWPLAATHYTTDADGAQVRIETGADDLTLHLVNVERGDGLPDEVSDAKAEKSGRTLHLAWKNPQTPDLDRVAIYNGDRLLLEVDAATESAELKNVAGSSLQLKTIDEAGRSSKGVAVHF